MYILTLTLFFLSIALRTGIEISPKFNPHSIVTGIAMLVMWVSWFGLNDFDPLRYTAHPGLAVFGQIILGAGAVIFAAGVVTVIKGLMKKQLVTAFVFKKIRHPMYYGMILWLLGYPLMTSSLTGLAAGPVGMVCILIWRNAEEKQCLEKLDGYAQYMKETWF